MESPERYRLPRTVIPSRYRLTLQPDLEKAAFEGTMVVEVDVVEAVEEIVVNALDLQVQEAWVEGAQGRIEASVSLDPELERCRLALSSKLNPGSHCLHARFRGVLNDKLVGFYRSSFTDESGEQHLLATTQMESTHARRAFPCWDEPDLKATFAVTLMVPDGLLALSNGAELPAGGGADRSLDSAKCRRVDFAETMRMSTYLVAFVIGPLEVSAPVQAAGTPLRVAYPPGKQNLTGFALESGSFALRFFSDYYGIGYPAGKLDLVAIPDFAFGAMENLGCITFRETALLVDPARATQRELQRVADVVHHEIAHMWFGDLVTMRWWNGLWLNEAFATFMEMKCTDAFRPRWKRWVDFGISRTAAFDVDALAGTRAIEFEVISPQDAEGMFDILTYEKGAAVLRMLEQFLGEQPFMEGVRHYLNTHAYGNTDTSDLWDSMEHATGQPVRRIMDGWIFRGGYPILEAALAPEGSSAVLRLSQHRFRYASWEPGELEDQKWAVPVLIRYGQGDVQRTGKILLETRDGELELDFLPEWVVVNAGATGFYRVRYSAGLLAGLGRLGGWGLNPSERYQLVDDAYAAVLEGSSTAAAFLDFARSFADETDLSVWQRLTGAASFLDRIVEDAVRSGLQARLRSLVEPAFRKLGHQPTEGEEERERQLRGTLAEFLGTVAGDAHIAALARSLCQRNLKDPGSVEASLAAASIAVVAYHGQAGDFEVFWRCYQQEQNPQLAIRFLFALASFRDPALAQRMLELSITQVRTQDAPYLLGRALANLITAGQVWDFIERHWNELLGRFPANGAVRMLEGIKTFTDHALAARVQAFFRDHDVPQGDRTLNQHLERMWVSVSLKQRESKALTTFLS